MKKVVKFHPKQKEAFEFDTQFGAAIAGVQSGKTFLGSYWAAKQISDGKRKGLICAPTVKILQSATLDKFFENFPEYRAFYLQQKGEIVFPNGQTVYVRSMDDPYAPEGITADWIWADEAGQFKPQAWTVLKSRVSATKGKILLTTTPYNMGWLYQDFYLPWEREEDDRLTVISWASVDNPYHDKAHFEAERRALTKEEFNRRYLGEFTRMEGLVYNLHNWHVIPARDIGADITIGGIDWGYTNPAALGVYKYHDGTFYVVDEWYEVGQTTHEIIEAAKTLQYRHNVNRWYADSANPEKIKEAAFDTGMYVIPYSKEKGSNQESSITAGISYINQLLNENRLRVFSHCKNHLNEFETYHYPESKGAQTLKELPEPVNNHLMDAMRYALHGYKPPIRFPVPKPTAQTHLSKLLNTRTNESEAADTSYE